MLSVRVFFEKKNGAKFISHLDLNRAVMRILVRTGLPVVFTVYPEECAELSDSGDVFAAKVYVKPIWG